MNRIVVFYIKHLFMSNVNIHGILDMDYFNQKENPLQYYDENNELQWEVPPNPYEKDTFEYNAYDDLLLTFKPDEKFIELLLESTSAPKTHKSEGYYVETESLEW